MFAFYFGVLADITPPVALAAYAGSAIAKSNPMKTGLQATKLGIAAFIIPYIFVYNPELLLYGVAQRPFELVWMIISAIIGISAIAISVEGYFLATLSWIERIMAFAGGLLLVIPGFVTDGIGALLLVIVALIQSSKAKKKKLKAANAATT